MLWRIARILLVVVVVVGWSGGTVRSQSAVLQANAPLGNAITYQGWLQQNGVAVEGLCDLRFQLFDAVNGAAVSGIVERLNYTVTGGYFTVSDLDFGAAFTGAARWLEVAVRCPAGSGDFTTLTPRQPLTAAPYALYAVNNWALVGNAGTSANTNFLGTTDAVTLTLKVSDTVALRLLPNAISPSVVGGVNANAVNGGVLGATIAGGGDTFLANRVTDDYGAIGGGAGNQVGDNAGTTSDRTFATVGGGRTNSARGEVSTIGGGQANDAASLYATVGGGVENNAIGIAATIGGGQTNGAGGENATVAGGIENSAAGANATVGGGSSNEANEDNATIAGGQNNAALAYGAVGGGANNSANGSASTVGGGLGNLVDGSYSTVSGGSANKAQGQSAVVGGGEFNEAQANKSTVSGGNLNLATAEGATVGGGIENHANGAFSTIAGGNGNIIGSNDATISGGNTNEASGSAATVGGGRFNLASANFGTISGGVDAHASHYGEWAYAAGGFSVALTGEAQTSTYVMRGTTTNNSSAVLGLGDASDDLTIASGRTVTFDIQIAARSAGGESAGYTFTGVIENQLGITSILGGVANPMTREDDTNWNVTVTADDSTDSLKITVLGGTGDSVRWVATVRTTEVQN